MTGFSTTFFFKVSPPKLKNLTSVEVGHDDEWNEFNVGV